MDKFDEMLKGMAEKEEVMVPEGFDKHVRDALDDLPSQVKKKGLGAVKGTLIAVAVCAALLCTAFAASPELRDMLAEVLGGFAPYAHEQKGEPYVIDGIEFRVVSALADDFTVRAYVEAKDLEGNRLSKLELNTLGSVFGMVDVPRKVTGEGVTGFTMSGMCLGYDEKTKIALLSVTSWGQVMAEDLSGSEVRLFDMSGGPGSGYQRLWENSDGVTFPVEIEPMPSFIADAEMASKFQAEEVRISALGLSVIFKEEVWAQFAGIDVRAKLTDGTLVEAPWQGGQGSFGTYGTETSRKVLIWNFQEPVELEKVDGIYVGKDYFPIRGLFSTQ